MMSVSAESGNPLRPQSPALPPFTAAQDGTIQLRGTPHGTLPPLSLRVGQYPYSWPREVAEI